MRTIPKAYKEIKKLDSETSFSMRALRRMCADKEIPTIKVGNKTLLNLDVLIQTLSGENIYMNMISRAKDYVYIFTPYLIIDNEMMTALTYAAKRDVDVKLILPGIPDKKSAFMLARTYYPELIQAGVKLYEYTPGFVHAKVFSSDDEKAVVGTINLDFRSLYLHFECATFFYKSNTIKSVENDFQNTLLKCKLVTMEDYKKLNIFYKIGGGILKLIAPLM